MIVVIFQHLRSREKTTTTTTASDGAFIVFRPRSFSNHASFETSPKKTRGGGGVSAKPSEEKKKPKDRERSASPNTQKKERKKENDGRTDKSTRSRDAYLELRFRPVRLGPVDPAERVLFARGVRSRRVFGCCHDVSSGVIKSRRTQSGALRKTQTKNGRYVGLWKKADFDVSNFFMFRVYTGF